MADTQFEPLFFDNKDNVREDGSKEEHEAAAARAFLLQMPSIRLLLPPLSERALLHSLLCGSGWIHGEVILSQPRRPALQASATTHSVKVFLDVWNQNE